MAALRHDPSPTSPLSILCLESYGDTIATHMLALQTNTAPCVPMMDLQPELEWYMRPYLIDFLIEVHAQFRMSPLTLHLAINLIDRYTSKRVIFKKHFQLVGCAALWIASKYEDTKDRIPTVRELRQMCCNAYDEDMFVQMEGHVLTTLSWELGHPTSDSFLQLLATKLTNTITNKPTTIYLARFLLELSLFHREFIAFSPCILATSALAAATYILDYRSTTTDPPKSDDQLQYNPDKALQNIIDNLLAQCSSVLPETLDPALVQESLYSLFLKLSTASAILTRKYSSDTLSCVSSIVTDYLAAIEAHRSSSPSSPPSSPTLPSPLSRDIATPPLTPVHREGHNQLPPVMTKHPDVLPTGLPTPPSDVNRFTTAIYPK